MLEFQQAAARSDHATLLDALEAARDGDADGQLRVAAALTWVAFSCPHAIDPLYDSIASVWLGDGESREIAQDLPEAPLDSHFWDVFWAMNDKEHTGVIPSRFQDEVANLALATKPDLVGITDQCAKNHPRIGAALAGVAPPTDLDPEYLSTCPDNSLGRILHHMIVGHGYSPEIVGMRLQQLRFLPELLFRVNARVVQMHRPWALVSGYDRGDSHEIAYGAFQVAQFGLNHAAMILANFATISCMRAPTEFFILLYLVAEGWRHGQQTVNFLEIDWDAEWGYSIRAIRRRHGIAPLRSVFSTNLFEVFGLPRR